MNREQMTERFDQWLEHISAYRFALTVIGIDANDGAPSDGAAYRNQRTALLSADLMRLVNDEEMYRLMEDLLKEDLDAETYRKVYLQKAAADKNRDVPEDEYIAYQKILRESQQMWLKAKSASDYDMYAPYLEKLINAYKKIISYRKDSLSLFDRVLDDCQKGWDQEKYDNFFSELKDALIPLIRQISACEQPDTSFMKKIYPASQQREFMKYILDYIHFDPEWGKIGESEHPLTTGICSDDIRFTTKYREYSGIAAVLSSMHESGHAYYTHQMKREYSGTPLARVSAGMQESQSRFCENHLARSEAFWQRHYPKLQELFPGQLGDVSFATFMRGISRVACTSVRIEADELTYPLHIIIRYELEKQLFSGELSVYDLRDAWNRKYEEYLGVTPEDDAHGVLQDMHWPYAYFGYFPTYALGSAFAAQFFHAMCSEIDPYEMIREDRYTEIMDWLKEHIHQYGAMYEADEIIEKATGEPFSVKYYIDWLQERYRKLYGLQ
ncbi:MAG: carboxypeptidase M32 [Solobacterium sp.]|nr:carboxypeptidase M32 [Solobacterium sp.]